MGEVNRHDIVTKKVLSNKTYAVDFIKNTLADRITSELNFSKLRIESGSFIDDEGKQYFTDMLYSIPWKQNKWRQDKSSASIKEKLGVFGLVEHKSKPDKDIHKQLLSYLAGIYRQKDHLCVVIPLVLYHGRQTWTIPVNFASCLNIPEHLRDILMRYVPEFSYDLLDLRDSKTEIGYFSFALQAFLQTLKEIWYLSGEKAVKEFLQDVLQKLRKEDKFMFDILFPYATQSISEKLGIGRVSALIEKYISKDAKEEFMTIAEKLRKDGIEEGIEKGKQEGIEKGKQEGIEKGKQETALNLLKNGASIDLIVKSTGLSKETIKSLDK